MIKKQTQSGEKKPAQPAETKAPTQTREELRQDYEKVDGAWNNSEKKQYADKYGVQSLKKTDIKVSCPPQELTYLTLCS